MIDRDKKIIDLYLNHPEISNKEIAKQFNISPATVTRIARINNLPRRTGNSGIRLSLDQEKEIVRKYLNSISLLELQNEYHISYDKIKSIIKKYTETTISHAKRLNPDLIENYFSKIDNPQKAYWLGWLISDGSITYQPEKSKFQIEVTLKKEDEEILHLLEFDLGVKNKTYLSQNSYIRFSLGCKKMVEDLVALGVTQNKTFTVKIPKIESKYYSHLLRGIFDGDGGFTVYHRTNGQTNQELSFCGNEFIVLSIQKILKQAIPELKEKKIENEASIKRIRWGSKKDIKLIADYLYKDCGKHYLKRKKDLIYANTEVTS